MNEKLLHQTFPRIYDGRSMWKCGPGWYPMLLHLSFKLHEKLEKTKQVTCLMAVNRYGVLNITLSPPIPSMEEEIKRVETLSTEICEECGKKGKMCLYHNQYKILCAWCKNE